MKKRNWGKKKRIIVIVTLVLVIAAAGLGGYFIYSLNKLNKLSSMTYEEMLVFTTKDNKDAVISVGMIQNDKMTYDVYGANGVKLSPQEHVYEIGSVTKTFTTSLLCKAISEGRISLDQTIDEYLPLPEQDYYPTIDRLLTHTSGYKGYYFEKPMISTFLHGSKNDFNGISEEMLINRLGKIKLEDSDYPFKYSNFGMATVGAVLEKVYDEDFSTLMNNYILKDFKLKHTKIADGTSDLKNGWEWSESDAYMPAGALLSTITDMMQYVHHQMSENPGYLSIAHEPLAVVDGTTATYEKMGIHIDAVGAGWMIDHKNNLIWHNGGTGHYNSYIGFDKEQQIGVVILSNLPPDYRIPATVIGVEILTALQNSALAPLD